LETPKRSTNVARRIIITIVVIIAVGILLSVGMAWVSSILPGVALNRTTVSYVVEGTTENAVITYTKSDGKVTEPESVSIPWRSPIYSVPSRTLVILTAAATESGTIKCTILAGDRVIDSNIQNPFSDKALCGGYIK